MKNVLLIDNDQYSRLLIKSFVAEDQVHFIECRNGEEAITWFDQQDINMVFLNTRLPDCEGRILLKLFKEKRPEIPVIGVSAEDPNNEFSKNSEVKFDQYFGLPLIFQEFQEKILRFFR